jgi:hypothetical protein
MVRVTEVAKELRDKGIVPPQTEEDLRTCDFTEARNIMYLRMGVCELLCSEERDLERCRVHAHKAVELLQIDPILNKMCEFFVPAAVKHIHELKIQRDVEWPKLKTAYHLATRHCRQFLS